MQLFYLLSVINRQGCDRVETEVGDIAAEIFIVALRADHCGVVRADGLVGLKEHKSALFALLRKTLAQERICRNSARDNEGFYAEILTGFHRVRDKELDDRIGAMEAQVGYV